MPSPKAQRDAVTLAILDALDDGDGEFPSESGQALAAAIATQADRDLSSAHTGKAWQSRDHGGFRPVFASWHAGKAIHTRKTYDPDQPRDDRGRFGEGDSRTSAEPEVESSLVKAYSSAKAAYAGAKAAAGRLGKAVYDRLPHRVQVALAKSYAGARWVEHQLEKPYHAAQKLVKEVVKERGLDDSHAERVARIVAVADGVSRWTGNVPGAHAALHALDIATGGAGIALSKVAYYIPVGSLAYLAYSTSRNPLATLRAAKSLVAAGGRDRGGAAAKSLAPGELEAFVDDPAIARLYEAIANAPDPDWYQALVLTALDETRDLDEAIRIANDIIVEQPKPPE